MLHVVEGIDLITSAESSSRVFSIATSTVKETSQARLKYALELMRASGMLEQSRHIFASRGPQPPGDLMLALRANGHTLSRIFAEAIIDRLRVEREMKGAVLTDKELGIVNNLRDGTKHFILGMSALQDRYFDRSPSAELVSAFFRKPPRWSVHVARVMTREKQNFLVDIGHNRIRLSPKGWSAVRLLRSKDAEYTPDRTPAAA
jgi:hypothetical protein